jgi:prolyl 4-hydroxylase
METSADSEALTALAVDALKSNAVDRVGEAVRALEQATRAGGIEAPTMLATLAALGVGAPHSWTSALNLLRLGAERGSASAQGQLEALAGPDVVASAPGGPEHWAALRQAIDVPAWGAPVAEQALCRSPRITRYDDYLPPSMCDWLIRRGEGRLGRARVFDPVGGGARVEEVRTNTAFEMSLADLDVVLAVLRFRVAATLGVLPGALEQPQILHYDPGEQFEPHYDFLDPDTGGHTEQLAHRGQRTLTFLVYLNEGFEGGETDFPMIGQRHKPDAGGALCFANVSPTGACDRRTLHAGLPPTRGEKWLYSQWIRDRAEPLSS